MEFRVNKADSKSGIFTISQINLAKICGFLEPQFLLFTILLIYA